MITTQHWSVRLSLHKAHHTSLRHQEHISTETTRLIFISFSIIWRIFIFKTLTFTHPFSLALNVATSSAEEVFAPSIPQQCHRLGLLVSTPDLFMPDHHGAHFGQLPSQLHTFLMQIPKTTEKEKTIQNGEEEGMCSIFNFTQKHQIKSSVIGDNFL